MGHLPFLDRSKPPCSSPIEGSALSLPVENSTNSPSASISPTPNQTANENVRFGSEADIMNLANCRFERLRIKPGTRLPCNSSLANRAATLTKDNAGFPMK